MKHVRKLPPELAKKAKSELNETEEALKSGVQQLKEWLISLPYIKEPLDDQWLASFLRGSKFSLERAKKKLEKFYTVRTVIPEFFRTRDPTVSPLMDLVKMGCILPLENKTDALGPCIMYFRFNYNPALYSLNDFVKYCAILIDIKIDEDDNFVVSGMLSVCDMQDVTFKHMRNCTPSFIKKCMKTFTDAYPLRTKGVHFLNPPRGFETVFKLVTIFAPSKIKSRLKIHHNFQSIFEHIPQKNLPKEYGGEAGTFGELTEKWKAKIESRKEFLIDGEKYCTDETLRSGNVVT